MLVLILGPSGAGKSKVIEELVRRYKWIPINSYITRPPREEDQFKISIDASAYDKLRASKQLFSDVSQLGHSYGVLTCDIESAIADSSPHVIDFSHSRRLDVFAQVPHLAVALVPESEAELIRRLAVSGRSAREKDALADMAAVQREAREPSDAALAPLLVLNERDRFAEAADHIVQLFGLRAINLIG